MVTKKGKQKSGRRYKKQRKKKKYEIKGQKRVVKLSEDKRKNLRVKGGNKKTVSLGAKHVNVVLSNNKTKKLQIKNVIETPSNKFLARQNIITKGTIIQTELGKVKVTNRPSQEGVSITFFI